MIYFLTVNYYSANLISKLISSIDKTSNIDYKVIIINNSLDDRNIDNLKTESVLIFNAETNLGFGCACNLGLKWIYIQDPQAYIWIINPDAYLVDNTLDKVQPFFKLYPEISILGTLIYTPTGEVWFAGGRFIPKNGAIITEKKLTNTNIDANYVNCDWISGCSLIVNLKNFSECPHFDSAYFLYYEDVDFCLRYASQGHIVAINNFSVLHEPSSITNRNIFQKIRYSTYSYLLTIDKYTNKFIFSIRLSLQILKAILGIILKPQAALGKICGIWDYLIKNRSKYK
ncbi:MAG: glycosyltransferase [Nostoc sp. DedVER02]|uniref:glycosyltransferase n=1 Tax=unclassified Nostoc TaxID=2593658 RepID=UPI002AD4021B|nr:MULTISPECIES: glycosyltransferase [unclassified Nostoc]MDZ7984972.1 glycosyltransferase family 2 protein [Nostoc sp. DedVER02]MDZ8114140.1 glycosyltransferase family 2 protein [Nostoc sp. DedVER01b]